LAFCRDHAGGAHAGDLRAGFLTGVSVGQDATFMSGVLASQTWH
jgi:hypothetical protein